MTFIERINRQPWLIVIALLVAASALLMTPSESICPVSAVGDRSPTDYCRQALASVTYLGAGTVENKYVRVPVNASGMVLAGQLDARAWDILPIVGSLTNEVNVLAQDMNSSNAAWYFHIPGPISTNETRTVTLYIGNDEQKRNQGILYTEADTAEASDHADFDITGGLDLQVELEVLDATVQDAVITSHYDFVLSEGWKLDLVELAGDFTIRATVDSHNCGAIFDSSWANENQLFRMVFSAAAGDDLFLFRNGNLIVSCDTDAASITAPGAGPQLVVGSSLDSTIIRDVNIRNGSTIVAHYGFDPGYMSETSAVNPTYTGTVQDLSPNNHDLSYTKIVDMTEWSVALGALTLVGVSSGPAIDTTPVDILGAAYGDSLVSGTPVATGLFIPYLDKIVELSVLPTTATYSALALALAIGLFIATWMKFKYVPLAMFVSGIPIVIFQINDWIPYWWSLLWIIGVVASWLAVRQGQEA